MDKWELGQHPAIANGWIIKPILFGANVRVLPESEGGHVIIRDEKIARLIAAAPELLEALIGMLAYAEKEAGCIASDEHLDLQDAARAAIAKSTQP